MGPCFLLGGPVPPRPPGLTTTQELSSAAVAMMQSMEPVLASVWLFGLVHASAAGNSNPSAVTTAIIAGAAAVVGALVGGVVTAFGQLLVESSRAKHQQEERTREDEILTTAAVRMLVSNWTRAQALFGAATQRGVLWDDTVDTQFVLELGDEERRVLLRHLSDDQWTKVSRAETMIAKVRSTRLMLRSTPGRRPDPEEAAYTMQSLKLANGALEAALDVLQPLARAQLAQS